MKTKTARHLAYDGLYAVFAKGAYSNLAMQQILRTKISPEDRKFLTEIVYGTIRRMNVLVWYIGKISVRPVSELDKPVFILLAMGLYQILFMNSVPDSAAVNETVEIAKKVTHAGNAKFINAILRNFLRKREEIKMPTEAKTPILYESLLVNEPEWLVKRWRKAWGKEKAHAVFMAFNEVFPTDIRVNTRKISVDAILKELTDCSALPSRISWCETGISVKNGGAFFRGDFLKSGKAYVQNRASMLPALVLSPGPGERVLDMCAAPGSKTTQMAEMMDDTGRIIAWDLYPHKVKLIQDNAKRLGISNIWAFEKDATISDSWYWETYDKVLLDAPCSGLGVIGRKPEIRWLRSAKELREFPKLQKKLIQAAGHYLKPGGILVYSTCTLEKAENEDIISSFLDTNDNFEAIPFQIGELEAPSGMLTLWPDIHHCDGFFTAKLRRKS